MSVRYLLQKLPSGEMLSWDLPLEEVGLTVSLSAPTVMSASITHERPELKALMKPYHVAIFCDDGSGELYGGILTDCDADGDKLNLIIAGYSYAPTGQPYTASEYSVVGEDALNVVRHIWQRVQSIPNGNLNLEVDETRSKVTVGTEKRDVEFTTSAGEDVSFESGPYTLSAWSVSDLGKELTDLFDLAGASFIEKHFWDGDLLRHRLQIDYPSRAVSRDDVRLVVGENVNVEPKVSLPGDQYAAEVLVVGAGEGRDMIVATSGAVDTGGLYRVAVHADKSITTKAKAQQVARQMVKAMSGKDEQITEIEVLQHPNCDLRTINPGDIVRVSGDTPWISLDLNVKVLDKSFDPSSPMTGTLAVEPI